MCCFFSSRRRHTRCLSDWSSDVCSSDLVSESVTLPQNVIALAEVQRSQRLAHAVSLTPEFHQVEIPVSTHRIRLTTVADSLYPVQPLCKTAQRFSGLDSLDA